MAAGNESSEDRAGGAGPRLNPPSGSLRASVLRVWGRAGPDLRLSLLFPLMTLLLAAPRVLRYSLTWDEPTYFHFARLQRGWLGELMSALPHPTRLGALLSPGTIHEVWLQDAQRNGHPPLGEIWMALAGLPFHLAGRPDLQAFRLATVLLLALTTLLLFRLLRQGLSRSAATVGVIVYLGVPAVWAHGHLGATETMQNFFWVLLALLLPRTLRKGRGALAVWTLACALAFMGKFTNILIPVWILGSAGILGAVRHRRFWNCALLGLVAAPLLLLLLDPFFWPWQDGFARFADYLRQTTTRSQWVPITVFYLGKHWGFRPPWHYRLVQTAAALPVTVLVLFLPGLFLGGRALLRALARSWRRREAEVPPASGWTPPVGWVALLGLTGFLFTLVVGWLPGTPNHDATRQFVFVFVFVALLAGSAADWVFSWARRRRAPGRRRLVPGLALVLPPLLALVSLGLSLAHEPWGLSYYSEWIGGARGAWNAGFELSYWSETITPALVARLLAMTPGHGGLLRVHTIPKLNYFRDAEDFLTPQLPPGAAAREPRARDVPAAIYADWAGPFAQTPLGPVLGLSFPEPVDAILIAYRRAAVGGSEWDLLDFLARHGDLTLLQEVQVEGVPLARLYAVPRLVEGRFPQDPENHRWFQTPLVHEREESLLRQASEGAPAP